MRVLITGSAGFLGGHVADAFVQAGHEVTGFDQRETNLPEVQSVLGDFLDEDLLTEVLADKDVICHIGAIGDVYLAAEQPALAASVNVAGSATVGRAAAKTGTRVVYASTWEVYGEPEYEPVDEQHRCEPDHPYNITKLAGERMLIAADRLRDVPVIALRLGTAYGLGMRPNSVFEIFIDKARKGEPITIQGDGSQGRQFTHARDIARANSAHAVLRGAAKPPASPPCRRRRLRRCGRRRPRRRGCRASPNRSPAADRPCRRPPLPPRPWRRPRRGFPG